MTRLLTEAEIEFILDFMQVPQYIPMEIAKTSIEINKSKLRNQLVGQKIYPEIIPHLKKEMEKQYKESLIQAGESVGVICAQSIGEKQTQTTLNTFHKAGQSEKTMTQGVPRFAELINATKKPRVINNKIYLNGGNSTIEETRDTVGCSIVGISFNDIALHTRVNLDKKEEPWYKSYAQLYDDNFLQHQHCITFKLNINKLFEYKLTMHQIAQIIHDEYDDLWCVVSPIQFAQIDIFVDVSNIVLPEKRILFVDSENAHEIYLDECVQPTLAKMNLCGIESITEIFYTNENGEWIVETNSINSRTISSQYISFKKLLALDIVDATRTISNNVWDIYEVLGIEAAREFLIEELLNIMDGINPCHAMLLVDRMTYGGNISSITRYTMKKDESGPFGKASFEETMDNFLNAASRGEVEPTVGVSASIICGKRANIGTGIMDLKLDLDNLPDLY